ncbi:MAG: hypothetical protein ABEI75_04670 [Halobaculum sp.]
MARDDPAADTTPDHDTDDVPDRDTSPSSADESDSTPSESSDQVADSAGESTHSTGDTFGVAIRVTDREFRFLVRVPSEIDAGWTDPDAFQSRIERVTWDRIDKRATLRAVERVADPGDTVSLGTVRMRPDGTVLDHSLAPPETE